MSEDKSNICLSKLAYYKIYYCLDIAVFSTLLSISGCQQSHSKTLGVSAQSAPVLSDPGTYDCSVLQSGLYWYGQDNQAQLATSPANLFYHAERPTVIYFHGWQANAHTTSHRETFNFETVAPAGASVNLADAWVAAGWNIGIFDWTQFSDADLVGAESKIWDGSAGSSITWKDCGGNDQVIGVEPGVSVADLAVQAIVTAMDGFQGAELRLVGHSLGSQLAAKVSDLLPAKTAGHSSLVHLAASRVAQLDPYWSNAQSLFQGTRADAVTAIAERSSAVWEMYKTSPILDYWLGAQNKALTDLIGEVKFKPDLWGNLAIWDKLAKQHIFARKLYFISLNQDQHASGCLGPCLSAAVSDDDVRSFMSARVPYVQNEGMTTETLSDDTVQKNTTWWLNTLPPPAFDNSSPYSQQAAKMAP